MRLHPWWYVLIFLALLLFVLGAVSGSWLLLGVALIAACAAAFFVEVRP